MSNVNNENKEVKLAEVIRSGQKIVIPDGLTIDDAIHNLKRQRKYETEEVRILEEINAFPWDGAYSLMYVLEEMFGFINMESTDSFFGSNPPNMISVAVGPNQTVNVPWGRMSLPGIKGFIETGYTETNGRVVFLFSAVVTRKDEALVKKIADKTRERVKEHSIYKGKAFRIRFKNDDGDDLTLPEITFLDVSNVNEDDLIYSDKVFRQIRTHLFTPIEKTDLCRKNNIPLKRGVLLAGPYGTGKTLAANVAAKKAQRHGWTFIYAEHSDELAEVIRFGLDYNKTVVYSEDIDRTVKGERTTEIDDILNTLDGVESKNADIMVILTTNDVDSISKAMLRPGRLDSIIEVLPPDAEAAEKLVRLYGRDLISPDEDLTEVGILLEGKIPAVIREIVERSKLHQLSLIQDDTEEVNITSEAIIDSINDMDTQLRLLEEKKAPTEGDHFIALGKKLGDALGRHIRNGIIEARAVEV